MYQCLEEIVGANEVLSSFGDSGLERVAALEKVQTSGASPAPAKIDAGPVALALKSANQLNQQILGVDVMEMFSPERVGKLCKEFGLEQGMAMDIKNG